MAGLIPALPDDVAMQCLLRVAPQAHAQLQRVSRRWRELVASAAYYEARRREGTSEKLVCVLQAVEEPRPASGGKRSGSPTFGISVLNVLERTWERLPSIPDLPDGLPIFSRVVAVEGKLVVLGGWNPATYEALQTVYVFDFVTRAWSRGAPMPTNRSFFACAAAGSYVYVAGGHDAEKTALRSAEVYSVDADRWAPLPPMRHERDEPSGVFFQGCFYVVSGYASGSQGQFTASAEAYNPVTNSWTLLDRMWSLETRSSRPPGPFAVMRGSLYTVQGHNLCRFNGGAWSVVEPLPDADVHPVCMAAVDDAILVTGPARDDPAFRTFVYKPGTNRGLERIERQAGYVGVAHSSHTIEI